MSLSPLFLNPDAPLDDRVRDLASRMTRAEKLSQLVNESRAVPRLGVPEYDWWNEALHGVGRAGRATVFPQVIGLAASFDEDLVERIGSAISDEARAKHAAALRAGNRARYLGLSCWSPNINIFRDPRWGRGQETWGEDPFLTGTLAAAFVRGMQGRDPDHLKTAACAKHFAVHSGPEKVRHEFDARVSLKDLHETYLPAFRALVDAGVEAVMSAYNRTNGEACSASPFLLDDILRKEWGFYGHVVSDCWAIRDIWTGHGLASTPAEAVAMALKAGVDLNCGDEYGHLADAFERGLIDDADIDRALGRLLRTRFRLGMFDPPERDPYSSIPLSAVESEAHRALALEAARKSLVLLKNRDGILPFGAGVRNIALFGPHAASVAVLLGNYHGISARMVTIAEGLAAAAGEGRGIIYKPGILPYEANANPIDWTVGEAAAADVIVLVLGIDPLWEGEEGDAIASRNTGDRVDIGLPPNQLDYLRKMAGTGKPVVVVLCGGSAVADPELHELAAAVLMAWYPGEEGGTAVADALFGAVSPSGRLPVTFVKSVGDLPPFEDYSMKGRTYRYQETEPLYPFGFGLSYATFEYSGFRIETPRVEPGAPVRFRVVVANEGVREGEELVQVYLSDKEASCRAPLWSLAAFRRVALAAGESRELAFEVPGEALSLVLGDGRRVYEPGAFELCVGGCSPGARGRDLGAPRPVTGVFELIERG